MRKLLKMKWAVGLVAAVAVFSVAYAFAATLGLSSADLGAGNATVSSCAATVGASYSNAYNSTAPAGYKVSAVKFTGLSSCVGQVLKATLTGASGTLGSEITHTVTAGEATAGEYQETIASPAVLAKDVTGIAVSIG